MDQSAKISGEELLAARTKLSHLALELVKASIGFALAFVVASTIVDLITDAPPGPQRWVVEVPIHLVIGGIALLGTSGIPIRNDLQMVTELVSANERELAAASTAQHFLRDVNDAFEMAENEEELYGIAGVALGQVAHSDIGGTELLVADSSGAHVTRSAVAEVGEAPCCSLSTPGSCPAVRRGQTLRFADPNGLASCPHLRSRQLDEGMGATCVPVTIMGKPSAVLHATYEFLDDELEYEKKVAELEGVAVRFGARLGMLRAMSQSQLQADTDPLTGLLNRRAMENRVRELRSEGREFALAMMDLDKFKVLNDTFGHDTGDRALRLFSRVLSKTVRDADLVCRHGGEEFVVVLPDSDVVTAAPVFHRLREQLADAVGGSQVPPFTVSVGLCDSSWSEDLQELLMSADRALMLAKEEGRDRLVIDDPNHTPNADNEGGTSISRLAEAADEPVAP